jgi:superfamily II DNA/RNA helicase
MIEPIFLDAVQEGETRLSHTITHFAVPLPPTGDRLESVTSCVEDLILTKGAGGQTIVFTNTKEEADNLIMANCFGQLKCQVLHGDIGQNSRQNTIRQFKEGQIDILVATDVAARGLDIAGVDLVVHTGAPGDSDTYVHRSGRTGRAGRSGSSVMLYTGSEERKLRNLESDLNFRFKRTGSPSPQEIAEASAIAASKRLELVTPVLARQFAPHARRIIHSYVTRNKISLIEDEVEDEVMDGEEGDEDVENDDESEMPIAVDEEEPYEEATQYSAKEVEELMSRCLAAISNRNSITSRLVVYCLLELFLPSVNDLLYHDI